MTLFDIAKKNMKGNFKNYFVYLISMLFCVIIYYTFTSLQYSTKIAKSIESSTAMQSIFMIGSIILMLFVFVFILYSNNFFARKRKKEVGLYSLLGLTKKTIGTMLFYENLIMGAIVVGAGILIGTFLSKLFSLILLRLLDLTIDIGMSFSYGAIMNTVIVFTTIILFTSFQSYRLIYRFKLTELFNGDKEGEQEPKASIVMAILAVICIIIGYWFAFQKFATTEEIFLNLSIMIIGIIVGTILLFSSLVIVVLKLAKQNKSRYYKGMNLISISNLIYRMKGNARTLSVISILSAAALSAFSVGVGMYYGHEESARLSSPFSYMYIEQDNSFHNKLESIISEDKEHPIDEKIIIPIIKTNGKSSSEEILSEREYNADENPIKVISLIEYNKVASVLHLKKLNHIGESEAISIRPMYTDKEFSDYKNETITLQSPTKDITLKFKDMTVERVINWSYPDIMIVVNDKLYQKLTSEITPINYIGYKVENQKETKKTADLLSGLKTPESKFSSYYSEYRLGKEGAAFNVFILGFLGLIFVMATGSIIYFKQLNEAVTDKGRYEILNKIGVSKKEIYQTLNKQILFIFLLPLIIGLAHYFVILSMLSRLFSAMAGTNMILPIVICVILFILIYTIYYFATVNSISKIVMNQSTSKIQHVIVGTTVLLFVLLVCFFWLNKTAPKEEIYNNEKVQLELPNPTGKYLVGSIELQLIDENRIDPWNQNTKRELMITIWYPTQEKTSKRAMYMQPKAAKYYDENIINTIGIDSGRIDLSQIKTHAWLKAPVAKSENGWPVIIYTPGGTIPRSFGTVLVEELVSKGYIVVTIDHTYETSVVEFPDGRIVTEDLPKQNADTILKMIDIRVDDVKYVLDQLTYINKGETNYKKEELPKGLNQALNLSSVGIFGHSAGGATSAQVMYEDNRFLAGIDMDGTMGYMPDYPLPVAENGLNRPFMLMNAGYNKDGDIDSHLSAQDRKLFWENSTGWKYDIAISKGMHFTFTDYQYLFPQIDKSLSLSSQVVQQSIGTGNTEQIIEAEKNYITEFFNLHLKNKSTHLFEVTKSPYSEIQIIK